MGATLLKKISLLFLLMSASFLSASFAGRGSKVQNKLAVQLLDTAGSEEIMSSESLHHDKEDTPATSRTTIHHERLLKVNTKDYGNHDPAPALVRPPFKLIPN